MIISRLCLFLGIAFIYLPIMCIVLYSFQAEPVMVGGISWSSFSLKWYVALWHNEPLLKALKASTIIGLCTATIATFLGACGALALSRYQVFRGRGVFFVLLNAPFMIPEVILGVAFLLMFVTLKQWIGFPSYRGMPTIVCAHTTLALSYVTVLVGARLNSMDRTLEEAASDLGAGPLSVLWHVILPFLSPALMAGWLLAFTLSFDDVVLANFVSGPGASTLPLFIYSKLRTGLSPDINALATLMILGMIGVLIIVTYCLAKKKGKYL
jgi:putrescine transport system permease protein